MKEEFRQTYYDNRPPLLKNFLPEHPFVNSKMTLGNRDENLAAWPRTKEVISDQLSEYYGLITQLDEQVGRIVKAASENSEADNTARLSPSPVVAPVVVVPTNGPLEH